MKIKYLGTAAAEGIPALFCRCDICKEARKRGGREIRTRSQAIIDEKLLIDFPADSYLHILHYNMDFSSIEHLLITHSHDDHFYPFDLLMRMSEYGHDMGAKVLHIYGNSVVGNLLKEFADRFSVPEVWNYMQFHELTPFEKFKIEDYTIYPLPSRHMRTETALIYLIEHNGKTILYGNDSSMFYDEVWEFFKGRTLGCVSLDCTMGRTPSNFSHMNYEDNVAVKKRLEELGCTTPDTRWICVHFSHNGQMLYREMTELAAVDNFEVAWDGMEVGF